MEFGSHVVNERLGTFNPVNNRVGIECRFVHLLIADGNDTTVWATVSKLARQMLPNRARQRVTKQEKAEVPELNARDRLAGVERRKHIQPNALQYGLAQRYQLCVPADRNDVL